jgi:UDP-N-acetylmuramoyl-tripeptide--D-alanyl-D-alanine ligase
VLGAMRELGSDSAAQHAELAATLTENGIDLVHAAGEMGEAYHLLPSTMQGALGASGEDIVDEVAAAMGPGDVVMVKGSNASRMSVIVAALLSNDEQA